MAPPDNAPFAHHLVLRLRTDRVIAPGLHERRLLARAVLEMGRGRELLAFGLADNHLHVQVISEREPALRLARSIGISITKRLCLPTGFAPTHAEPILTMVHCRRAFRYILCQGTRHGLQTDPDWEGTNLPDLLGLRPFGAHTAAVARRWLPRLSKQDLLGWAGVGA